MTPPSLQPTKASIEFADGATAPLIAVYIGKRPAGDEPGAPELDTWTLWGDPNLEHDIEFSATAEFSVKVDCLPGNSQLVVHQELVRRIPRHPG